MPCDPRLPSPGFAASACSSVVVEAAMNTGSRLESAGSEGEALGDGLVLPDEPSGARGHSRLILFISE